MSSLSKSSASHHEVDLSLHLTQQGYLLTAISAFMAVGFLTEYFYVVSLP